MLRLALIVLATAIGTAFGNLFSNLFEDKHLWEILQGADEPYVSFNFGTENVDQYFNNSSVYIGAIINKSDEIVRYLDFTVASSDSIALYDVDKHYVDKVHWELNTASPNEGGTLFSRVELDHIEFPPDDTIMVLFACQCTSRFRIVSRNVNKTAKSSADVIPTQLHEFRPQKRRLEAVILSNLFFLAGVVILFLITLYLMEKRTRSDYQRWLDDKLKGGGDNS